jgi:hypothetical protein
LIFISQSYLLDQTPSLFGLSLQLPFGVEFKFNANGFYYLYLVIYAFMLDFFSGVCHLIYLLLFFGIVPRFGRWVTSIVGVKSTYRTAFVLYLFGQISQILAGHLGREDFYDWNIYQVSLFVGDGFMTLPALSIIEHSRTRHLLYKALSHSATCQCLEYYEDLEYSPFS